MSHRIADALVMLVAVPRSDEEEVVEEEKEDDNNFYNDIRTIIRLRIK